MNDSSIHIFRAGEQSATRYKCDAGFWIKFKPTKLLWCWNCRKRRQAKNLKVQSYYDGDRFFCKGGCKPRKRGARGGEKGMQKEKA